MVAKRKRPALKLRLRDMSYFKPARYQHYLTIAELAEEVDRGISWLRTLERRGDIPQPRRVTRGELAVRLYSPEQVTEIKQFLSRQKPGRPRNA